MADCLDVYSLTDSCESQVGYAYDLQQYIGEFQDHNALLRSMAVTECNLHVGAPQSKHMHGMSKPQFYDFIRKHKENKLLLRDYAKGN